MSVRTLPLVMSFVVPLSAQVDWRSAQSPVKDQGNRGTCAAFAICGALETFPGVPGDLSEQLLYATRKLHQNDVVNWMRKFGQHSQLTEGDLFDVYVDLFANLGTCCESFLPYDPDPKRAAPSVPDDLKRYLELAHVPPGQLEALRDGYGKYGFTLGDCTVLPTAEVRDVERLQKLLADGVLALPVGYAVHGPSWSKLAEVGNAGPDGKRVYVHPGMMARFAREGATWLDYNGALLDCMQRGERFVDAVENGALKVQLLGPKEQYGGHAVLLVGYDDRGFLVKNSWGTGWGDGGYFRITYDYHRLYAGQGLVLAKARIRNPALSPFETTKRIRDGRFRVKVQPRKGPGGDSVLLSTWMEEPRDAAFTYVEYTVIGNPGKPTPGLATGDWVQFAKSAVPAGDSTTRTGAPLLLSGKALDDLRACSQAVVKVRYGWNDRKNDDGTVGVDWVREGQSAVFSPRLEGAVDLPVR
jgi:hypothetical protein